MLRLSSRWTAPERELVRTPAVRSSHAAPCVDATGMVRFMPENDSGGGLDVVADREVMVNLLPRLPLPAYLAAVLTQADEALIARDVALHAGDEDVARDREERVAGLLCVALTRAADEFRMPPGMQVGSDHARFLRGEQSPADVVGLTLDQFREQELHLLRLVGLSQGLAVTHLDAAFAAVLTGADASMAGRPGAPVSSVAGVYDAFEAAAEAACATHQAMVRKRRAAEDRRWRSKVARRCVLAAGGVLIVVANAAALPFITPFGAAASAALGGGAAGAAANLIER